MEPLLVSLYAAAEAAPSDVPLRLHLAELLLEREDTVEATKQCATALAVDPLHEQARSLMRTLLGEAPSVAAHPARGDRTGRDATPHRPAAGPHDPGEDLLVEADAHADLPTVDDTTPGLVVQAVSSPRPPHQASHASGFDGGYPWAERANVTLADIGGMDVAKERLEAAVLAPMRNPEMRRLYRKSRSGGVLLYGPPGCGKTFLARATAGELAARFLPLSFEDRSEEEQARQIAAVFQAAREQAPVVLCLRRLEQLGARPHDRRSASSRSVAALVAELDKGPEGNPGVTVMGTANRPWAVDPVLQRAGRLEQKLLVLPPDQVAREVVLRQHAREHPEVDTGEIARLSSGYSAADIVAALRTVEARVSPVTTQDVLDELLQHAPSARTWLDEARAEIAADPDPGSFVGLREYIAMADRRSR